MTWTLKTTLILMLLPFAALASAQPTVTATVYGECHDQDGSGGSDELTVSYDAATRTLTATHPSVTGAVDAATNLADNDGNPATGNGCTSPQADRLQAIVIVDDGTGPISVGVCYDGQTTIGAGYC